VKLAQDMGAAERSFHTHLKELEATGILEIQQRGLGKTNLYRLQPASSRSYSGEGLALSCRAPREIGFFRRAPNPSARRAADQNALRCEVIRDLTGSTATGSR
jgi:hypothetical protein